MKGWELEGPWRQIRSQSISPEIRDLQSKIHCEVRGNSCSGSSRSTQGHTIKSSRASAGKIELRETCCFHSAG